MSQTLTISDELYAKLINIAEQQGYDSLEAMLHKWHSREVALQQRAAAIRQINDLHEGMQSINGIMRNSVDLLREDRKR